ncbi:CDK-activating kinase assembly factor MAT1-domain-containing protein [Haematococcus lacustris]
MDDLAKELKCRKRICAIYNKTSEDFNTKEEWDRYLEGIEDIIYNLVNGIDVQATEARVSDYERTNRVHIIAKQAKQVEAQRAAQVAAFQAAAASTVSATAAKEGDAPAGYVPTAATASSLLTSQPVPVGPVAQDAHGSIVAPAGSMKRGMAAVAASANGQEDPGATAAGWSPELPRMRALQEAFGSLLLPPWGPGQQAVPG